MKSCCFVIVLIFGHFLAPSTFAQDANVVVEVEATSAGNVADPGKRLYLRVFEDGRVEYDNRIVTTDSYSYSTDSRKVSSVEIDEFIKLTSSLVESVGSSGLKSKYRVLDHEITLEIRVFRNNQVFRTMAVTNFNPKRKDSKTNYSVELLKFFEIAERIRTKSNIEFF